MTNQTVPGSAPGLPRHHSQSDHYTSAIYLAEMLKAIEFLDGHQGEGAPSIGALVTIAVERADDLSADLSRAEFEAERAKAA